MNLGNYSTNKLENVLNRRLSKAIGMFDLIEDGDKVLVALSGGVDSKVMLHLLNKKEKQNTWKFTLKPVHIDIGFEKNRTTRLKQLKDFCSEYNYELEIIYSEIAQKAFADDAPFNPCFICSRIRRKKLIELADEAGFNKIALGHHKDDIIETLFINIFYGREISTMIPNQPLFNGRFRLIRPLALANEAFIKEFANRRCIKGGKTICPQERSSKRAEIKQWLADIFDSNRIARKNVFRALFHPKPEYLFGQFRDDDV